MDRAVKQNLQCILIKDLSYADAFKTRTSERYASAGWLQSGRIVWIEREEDLAIDASEQTPVYIEGIGSVLLARDAIRRLPKH